MNEPLVSVILPCYNSEQTIFDATISIIDQTYRNLEIIIISDGCTDKSDIIIGQLSNRDSRIRHIQNVENKGLIESLNIGISLAKGKYLARMDADDVSVPNRIALQVKLMESDLSLAICSGSRLEVSKRSNKVHKNILPLTDNEIRVSSIFSTPFAHPCVLMRTEILINNNLFYSESFKYAEDYEFWLRVLEHGRGQNLADVLLVYNVGENSQTSIGSSKKEERFLIISKIQQRALAMNNITLDKKSLDLQYILSLSSFIQNINFDDFSVSYIKKHFIYLKSALKQNSHLTTQSINYVLGRRFIKIIAFNYTRLNFLELFRLSSSQFTFYGFLAIIRDKFQ